MGWSEAFTISIQSSMPPAFPTRVEALALMTSLMRSPAEAPSALERRLNSGTDCSSQVSSIAAAPMSTITAGSDPIGRVCCHADFLFFFPADWFATRLPPLSFA